MNAAKLAVVYAAALLGWVLCAATMRIGISTVPVSEALVIHALAAPIFFVLISVFYFQRFAYTTPLQTAFIFVSVVMFMDFAVVGLLVNGSLKLFANLLGTWIPFILIFSATHITGLLVTSGRRYSVSAR